MAPTAPLTPEPRPFSTRLPRPLWIGVGAVVLVVVAVGLRIGIPIDRQKVAIRDIETLKLFVRLPKLETVTLTDTMVTDAGVAELQRALPNLKIIR